MLAATRCLLAMRQKLAATFGMYSLSISYSNTADFRINGYMPAFLVTVAFIVATVVLHAEWVGRVE